MTRTVFATGTPREAGRLEFVRNLVTHGRFFDAGDRPQVVLGKKLAKDLGFPDPGEAIGKRVLFEARGLIPSGPIGFHFDQRTVEVEIVGIYEAPDILGFEAMGQALVLPLDLIRTLPGVRVEQALERMREGSGRPLEGHGRVVVRTYRTSDVPEAEKAIQKLGFKTRSLVTQLEEMKTFFVLMDLLLAAVGSVTIATQTGANSAISVLDAAIQKLTAIRADLGAVQNRFGSTISNLETTSENLEAARSRVRDADFAAETEALTRGQILQQAGTAILAQANALPNGVLALLRS